MAQTNTSTKRVTKTATSVVSTPMRVFGHTGSKKAPVSDAAQARVAAAREAFEQGAISREDYESRKRSYEYFGQREAAGYRPFDLPY